MMKDALEYEYRVDAAEALRVSEAMARRRSPVWWQVRRYAAVPAIALFVGLTAAGVPWREVWWLLIVVANALLLPLWLPWLQRRQLAKAYREAPTLQGPQRYRFDAQGLSVTGAGASSTLAWDAILDVAIVPDGFVFYFHKHGGYVLPLRAIGDSAAQAELRAFILGHMGERATGLRAAAA